MSYSKQVFVIGFWPDYEEYSFNKASIPGFDITTINPKSICYKRRLFSLLPRQLKNRAYWKLVDQLTKAHPDALFIFQDTKVLIEFFINIKKNVTAILILRNSIDARRGTESYIPKLKKKGVSIWSFDKVDCEKYALNHYEQFGVKYTGIEEQTIHFDFCFIGRDKGRAPYLEQLKEVLEANGFSVDLQLIRDKDHEISYREYLTRLCQAKCIIDIVQDNQSGLTLRPIEATFYKRKLLSNNRHVASIALFHPDNIFIINHEFNLEAIETFMDKPLYDMPKDTISQYNVNSALTNILGN